MQQTPFDEFIQNLVTRPPPPIPVNQQPSSPGSFRHLPPWQRPRNSPDTRRHRCPSRRHLPEDWRGPRFVAVPETAYGPLVQAVPTPGMIMKLPATNGSGNGYYGHDSSGVIISYPQDPLEINQDDLDSPTVPGDFSEYMWMENEEEFDKQVMQQLEEELLMEQCIEAMLEDERESRNIHNQAQSYNLHQSNNCNDSANPAWNGAYATNELCQEMSSLGLKDELARKSTLNPNAAEFVPGNSSSSTVATKDDHIPPTATSMSTTSTNSDSKDSSQAQATA